MFPAEMHTDVQQKICIRTFVGALFITAPEWKQPKCSSMSERYTVLPSHDGNCPETAAAAKSLQSCPTLCDPIDSNPPGSPVLGFSRQEHWSGLHFLLQYIKVKSESEVTQSCLTLSDPMDYRLPGSSIHGIFQAKVLEWGAIAFSRELFSRN